MRDAIWKDMNRVQAELYGTKTVQAWWRFEESLDSYERGGRGTLRSIHKHQERMIRMAMKAAHHALRAGE